MGKQEDPFDTLQTGVYMDSLKEEHDLFSYNMRTLNFSPQNAISAT